MNPIEVFDRQELYRKQEPAIVYRIFDPEVGKFCCSGRGLYAGNGRSVWASKSGATVTLKHLPADVKARVVIKAFRLIEVEEAE